MNTYVALLRGINVGTAKSVPMAELAAVVEQLGFTDVTTVLRSGNVVFSADPTATPAAPGAVGETDVTAAAIEAALLGAVGVQSNVLVLAADDFVRMAAANPLTAIATDGAKAFITFLSSPGPTDMVIPSKEELFPEVVSVTSAAVYQWIPGGSTQSKLRRSFWAQFPTPVTTRNLNTVERLLSVVRR